MSERSPDDDSRISRRRFLGGTAGALAALSTGAQAAVAKLPSFEFQEATLATLGERMSDGGLSSRALTAAYLERIAAVDRAGPELRSATVDVLMRTAKDQRMQRIFEIAYHKCEYVGDAIGVRERHMASQAECLKSIEASFRTCIAAGELPKGVNARVAAVGAMSLVSGLIANWVLDPASFPLHRHAEALVDIYFRGLASTPAKPATARRR